MSGTSAALLAALRRRPRELAKLGAWSAVEMIPVVLSGRAVAGAVDDGFRAGDAAAGFGWLGLLAAAVLAAAVATRQIYLGVAAIVEPFRDELVRCVVGGAIRRAAAGAEAPGAAGVARLTRQVEVVRDTFAGMVVITRNFAFTLAGALAGLVFLAPEMLVFVLPPLAVGLAMFFASLRALARRQRALALADEDVAGAVGAAAGGLRDITAAGGEGRTLASAGARVEAQAAAVRAVARMTTVRTLSVTIGGWTPVVLVLLAAPWLIDRGATPGTILGVLTYIVSALQPALQTLVNGVGGSGLQLMVNLNRILETGHRGRAGAPPVREAPPRAGRLDLSAVTFAYGPAAEPVVRDLDLTVAEDDHLAIVGPSGIGKSTVALLLAGLLAPRSGPVRLDGVPVGELDGAYRVLIPQEAYVFSGTLAENLAYFRPAASPAELDSAVERVGMRALRDRLGGYDAGVAPAALSAGERQLIALARAYLSPAPLAILDEATCHLDPAAEERAERAFAARPGALVVVAHRMSSALRARRILLMDGARPLLGTHEELLAAAPAYRDLAGRWELGMGGAERRAEPPGPERRREPADLERRAEPPGLNAAEKPAGLERRAEPPGRERRSEPAGLGGDAHRVDPVARAHLADDAGDVVPDGAHREK